MVLPLTSLNVNEARGGMEVGEGEGVGLQNVPQRGNPGALELVLILVPHISDTALRLDPSRRLAPRELVEPALLRPAQPGLRLPPKCN